MSKKKISDVLYDQKIALWARINSRNKALNKLHDAYSILLSEGYISDAARIMELITEQEVSLVDLEKAYEEATKTLTATIKALLE